MALPLAGSQTLLRSLNARAILDLLAQGPPRTRAELMSATGLSRTAVTQVLRMLENAGAVRPAGVDRETKGPAATRFALVADLAFGLAVHMDRHRLHLALVDVHGRARAERSAENVRHDDRAERLAALAADLPAPLLSAVVGIPGIVAEGTRLRDDQGPDGGMLHRQLVQLLGCPVELENDINLAAVAEQAVGAAQGLSDVVLLSVGEGLGAAIVIGGSLHRGSRGLAGEVGYLPQPEVTPGTPVLGDEVYQDLARAQDLDPAAPLSVHLDAAARGEQGAVRMLEGVAARIHTVAATVALTVDPQAFLLSGYGAHPALFAAVQERAEAHAHLLPLRFELAHGGAEATLTGAIVRTAAALREALFTRLLDTPEGIRP